MIFNNKSLSVKKVLYLKGKELNENNFDIFIEVLRGINNNYMCNFIGWFMLVLDI